MFKRSHQLFALLLAVSAGCSASTFTGPGDSGSRDAAADALGADARGDVRNNGQQLDGGAADASAQHEAGPSLPDSGSTMPQCPRGSGPLPAFPCAEGFGATAKGGRGGDVYHVTTLADDGAGSLRRGISSATGPRTIVFEIGGEIKLKSTLLISTSYLTIAGQTAPGDGITIRDRSVMLKNAHHIVIRFLRIRRGDVDILKSGKPTGSIGLDTVSIDDSSDIIFDHVSLSWSCDEIFGVVQNKNVTLQWLIISEPLGDPKLHPYGNEHAYGLNLSATTLSLHHSLVANYVMRGPQFEANDANNNQGYHVYMEAVNNVLFDYERSGSRYTTGIETNPSAASKIDFFFHFRKNHYLRDPLDAKRPEIRAETKHGVSSRVKVHVAGNIGPNRPQDSGSEWSVVWTERDNPSSVITNASSSIKAQMSNATLFAPPIPIKEESAAAASVKVLGQAGFSSKRDAVDKRIIDDVKLRRWRAYLHSQAEVGGWPTLGSGAPYADSDRDGMADAWEIANGLDPKNPADRNGDLDGDGWTNLEAYLDYRARNP